MVIHHTRCGLEGLDEEGLRSTIEKETGVTTQMAFGSFNDAASDVQKTAARLSSEPALQQVDIQGFVFDVDNGLLTTVQLEK